MIYLYVSYSDCKFTLIRRGSPKNYSIKSKEIITDNDSDDEDNEKMVDINL